jgi:hypothetical protein
MIVVEMPAPQATGAMISMSSAGCIDGDVETAVPATERVPAARARVRTMTLIA